MRKLNKQFEAARNEYRQIRYDRDLATEILGQANGGSSSTRSIHWSWKIAAFAAAAAVIVLFVRPQMPINISTNSQLVAVNEPEGASTTDTQLALVEWSDLPSLAMPPVPSDMDTRGSDEMNMSPAVSDFSISVPSFTLLEDPSGQQLQSNSAINMETVL